MQFSGTGRGRPWYKVSTSRRGGGSSRGLHTLVSLRSKPMRNMRNVTFTLAVVGGLGVVGGGCLTRPVVHQDPTTKENFTTTVRQQAVDKIDLLFDIDNSASMGDKQEYLKQAIPDLIKRLVQPNCVATDDPTKVVGQTDAMGACATGKPEFPPVHNMHIGVVTSALGPR